MFASCLQTIRQQSDDDGLYIWEKVGVWIWQVIWQVVWLSLCVSACEVFTFVQLVQIITFSIFWKFLFHRSVVVEKGSIDADAFYLSPGYLAWKMPCSSIPQAYINSKEEQTTKTSFDSFKMKKKLRGKKHWHILHFLCGAYLSYPVIMCVVKILLAISTGTHVWDLHPSFPLFPLLLCTGAFVCMKLYAFTTEMTLTCVS